MNPTLESPFLDAELPQAPRAPVLDRRALALAATSPFVDAFGPPADAATSFDAGETLDDRDATSFEALDPVERLTDREDPPSSPVEAALKAGDWAKALDQSIADGIHDDNALTNRVFFARHPELPRAPLDRSHPKFAALSAEWQRIRDKEVWDAIVRGSGNTSLAVSGDQAASGHRHFWAAGGTQFKQLVARAATDVGLNPGLLASVLIAETFVVSYLSRTRVSSYEVGVDDFYESRASLEAKVPAYRKVRWDRKQKPIAHPNDAQGTPRTVQTIFFDSGPDALLAVAVYLKFREVRLREEAAKRGKDFDALPLETRWALIRGAMGAGVAGITPSLEKALAGTDILVRKNIPPKAYQTLRNATIRAAEALHLSDWIFGQPMMSAPAGPPPAQPELGDPIDETEETDSPGPEWESETGIDTKCSTSGHGIIGRDDRQPVSDATAVPYRFICQLFVWQRDSNGKITRSGATGVLISPRHVLTAAHVLIGAEQDDRNQWVTTEATSIRVCPGRDGQDRPFGTYEAKLPAQICAKWNPRQAYPGFDYAVLTLKQSIGDETFKQLGGHKLGYWGSPTDGGGTTVNAARPEALNGRDAQTAGYPNDRGGNESPFVTTGQLSQVDARVRHMNYSADACQGQSGSPVWVEVGGKYCMVGLLVKVIAQTNVALRIGAEVCADLRAWVGKAATLCASTSPGPQPELEADTSDGCRCHDRSRSAGVGVGLETDDAATESEASADGAWMDGESFAGEGTMDDASDGELMRGDEAADDTPWTPGVGQDAFAPPTEGERRQDPALRDIAERVAARLHARPEQEFDVARSKWTTCFELADVQRVRTVYQANDTAAAANAVDRCSCIVMLNVGLGQLLQIETKTAKARGKSTRLVEMAALTTESIEKAMAQLVKAGYALRPKVFDFVDARKKRAGTLEPVALASSVQAGVLKAAPAGCWSAFGLSVMDGYHSVLLLVDRTGATDTIYWLDQFAPDVQTDVTSSLDELVTTMTVEFWRKVKSGKKVGSDTMLRLWPLRRKA